MRRMLDRDRRLLKWRTNGWQKKLSRQYVQPRSSRRGRRRSLLFVEFLRRSANLCSAWDKAKTVQRLMASAIRWQHIIMGFLSVPTNMCDVTSCHAQALHLAFVIVSQARRVLSGFCLGCLPSHLQQLRHRFFLRM